jgi:phage shock protein A
LKKHLEDRLTALRAEFEKGQAQLRQMEAQIHRIHGAMIVLEELLKQPELEDNVTGPTVDSVFSIPRPIIDTAGKTS